MLVSLCYRLICWLLEFGVLRVRSEEFKELEIVILRHELAILKRTTRRPVITAVDRVLLAFASRLLPRVRPLGDQAPMPAQQRRRRDDEGPPT